MTHTMINFLYKVAGAVAGPGPLGQSSSRGRHTEHKAGRAEVGTGALWMTSRKQRRQEDKQEQEDDRSKNHAGRK